MGQAAGEKTPILADASLSLEEIRLMLGFSVGFISIKPTQACAANRRCQLFRYHCGLLQKVLQCLFNP
ncbi:MAG: hypothetical protein Q7J21_10715 [Rugosibacter sp.]|nr:hypothetical protein [Rugosibacter sp.]